MAELVNKQLMKLKAGPLPKTFEELLNVIDIFKRQAQHQGACEAMNELKAAVWDKPKS